MYNDATAPIAAGVAGSGTLAMTGAEPLWVVLSGFALLALGLAVKRIVPMKQEASE